MCPKIGTPYAEIAKAALAVIIHRHRLVKHMARFATVSRAVQDREKRKTLRYTDVTAKAGAIYTSIRNKKHPPHLEQTKSVVCGFPIGITLQCYQLQRGANPYLNKVPANTPHPCRNYAQTPGHNRPCAPPNRHWNHSGDQNSERGRSIYLD